MVGSADGKGLGDRGDRFRSAGNEIISDGPDGVGTTSNGGLLDRSTGSAEDGNSDIAEGGRTTDSGVDSMLRRSLGPLCRSPLFSCTVSVGATGPTACDINFSVLADFGLLPESAGPAVLIVIVRGVAAAARGGEGITGKRGGAS